MLDAFSFVFAMTEAERLSSIAKLFTHKDPMGFHKYAGIITLFHFAFYYHQMIFGDIFARLVSWYWSSHCPSCVALIFPHIPHGPEGEGCGPSHDIEGFTDSQRNLRLA